MTEPWGHLVRFSVYVKGGPPSSASIELAAEAIEEELGPHAGRAAPEFIGVDVEPVQEKPVDSGGS